LAAILNLFWLFQDCGLFSKPVFCTVIKLLQENLPVTKMRAALTHPASKFSKTSLYLDAFVCYVFVVKRMKLKTNLVF